MLYDFPNESPEELLEKEGLLLEEQIWKASRVEKFGYRKKECSLKSSYIEWRCFHEYLKCPINKWKLPKTSTEKIEVEPLPTDFISPYARNWPMYFKDPDTNEKVMRVVGFREIKEKREYQEYLRDVEMENWWDDEEDDDDDDSRKVREEVSEPGEEEVEEEDGQGQDQDDNCGPENHLEEDEREREDCSVFCNFARELARGGGKSKKGGGSKSKAKSKSGGKGKTTTAPSSIKAKGDAKSKSKQTGKGGKKEDSGKNQKVGLFRRLSNALGIGGKGGPKAAQWQSKHKEKDIAKTAAQLEKENKENLEEIFKYHGFFRVPAMKEKDNEWLLLSDSDEATKQRLGMEPEINRFDKTHLPWMDPEISYESQFLVKTMKPFMLFLSLSGRQFLGTKKDYEKKHVDFLHRRRDQIVFFLTGFFFWVCFVLVTVSFIDIQWENQSSGKRKVTGHRQTLDDMKNQFTYAQHQVEELELTKYQVPVAVVLINLSLTAIWSLLMILGDGIYVAHYFNCWCAALAEMETSGCLGIRRKIYLHQLYFLIYAAIVSVGFVFNYPKQIRYASGEILALIVRSFDRSTRIRPESQLLPYQLAGLLVQIYIMYCCSMIKLMMQILAIILKNASEMWNFKFALTFDQCSVQ